MDHKPGETVHELAARIRHDAVTCDFPSISDPLDEAMRTCFMCSVNNEAVLKALFKHKEDDLTFAKAVAVAVETDEAAKWRKRQSMVWYRIPFIWSRHQRGVHLHQVQDHSTRLFTEGVIFPLGPVHAVEKRTTSRLTVFSRMLLVDSARSQGIWRHCA